MTKANKLFKSRIKEKFGDKISPLEEYISMRKTPRIKFSCSVDGHPDFTVSTSNILRKESKFGCPICAGNQYSYTEEIVKRRIKELFGDNITLESKWVLNETKTLDKLTFKCKKHGFFEESLNNIVRHNLGCSKCAYEISNQRKRNRVIEKLEKLLENTNLSFNPKDYKNANTPIRIFDSKHKKYFKRAPGKFLYEGRLASPFEQVSHGESVISSILEKENISFTVEKTFDDLKYKNNLFFDFFLDEYKILIEHDGTQHYDSDSIFFEEDNIKRDSLKDEYVISNNMRLLRIVRKNNKNLNPSKIMKIEKSIKKFINSSTTIEKIFI